MYGKSLEKNGEKQETKTQPNAKHAKASNLGKKSVIKERFTKILDELDRAVLDYSRAIHIAPTNHLLYLYRGNLLLRKGCVSRIFALMYFRMA
jgi:hypothetical protein